MCVSHFYQVESLDFGQWFEPEFLFWMILSSDIVPHGLIFFGSYPEDNEKAIIFTAFVCEYIPEKSLRSWMHWTSKHYSNEKY